ncbi:MAG: hypothetical protein U1E25_12620 [Methylocystis sp.]
MSIVKYFSAEKREAERYDKSMIRCEQASTQSYVSLAVLNAGQTVIYIIGLTAMMVMCVYGIEAGLQYSWRFRVDQSDDGAAGAALEFHGHLYRERCVRRSSTSKRCFRSWRRAPRFWTGYAAVCRQRGI